MAKADNRLHFRCSCGEKVEAYWKAKFPFGKKQWIAEKCRVCREVTDLSGIEVIPCPHCQSIVIKGEKFCMECNQPLDVTIETLPIICPNKECEMTIYLPRNYKGDYVCRSCGKKVKEDDIRRQLKGLGTDRKPAMLIELPSLAGMKGRIIHKEEGTQFPYGSRIQVSEGTYGLLMQNGVCQYPLTPGTHLLSETKLSQTSLLDAALQGEDVVFNTEVFCVVKKLPALEQQLRSTPIRAIPKGDAPAQEFVVSAACRLLCQVDDAKAFVSHAGFQAVSEAGFLADASWMQTRTKGILSTAFDKTAHAAFEIFDSSRNTYTYKAEMTRLLKAEIALQLAEDGLCLDEIDLLDITLTETEDSKAKQKEYADKCGRIETVKLPDVQQMREKRLVIYQHDKDVFEYKSRVQVSEGTYGLLLQNGACQPPLMPGSYLLSDCALEGTKRYDAAMNGENVVFHSSLFCVTQMLPALEWYHPATFTDLAHAGDAPAKEYSIKAEGTVRIQVDDAKRFAAQVGFGPLPVAELCHAYRPNGQLPVLNIDLEKDYPAENKDGWLYVRVKSILKTIFDSVCLMVFGDRVDIRRLSAYRLDFSRMLQNEFNMQLKDTGLSVTTLDISLFTVEETQDSRKRTADYQNDLDTRKRNAEQQTQTADALIKAAKTQFLWNADNIELHLKDHLTLKARAAFHGDCRLEIVDKEQFFAIPEIQTQSEAHTPDLIRPFLEKKLQSMIEDHLAHIAQEFIDLGKITDLLDRYAYRKVSEYVLDEINRDLARDGMKIHTLNISIPDSIVPDKALKDHLAISEKKEKIRAYAERKLLLKTEPILVHMKGDPTVFVKAIFSGDAYLRVADAAMFFETSEVKGFLAAEPFVSEAAVNAYYTERINSVFADLISRIVQAIVDQTNADIRELHRLSGLLQSNVLNALNDRVGLFGMRLEALDMHMPTETVRSQVMQDWIRMHETKSGLALQQEIDKLQNDHSIFVHSESNRVVIAKEQSDSEKQHALDEFTINKLDSADLVDEKKAELAMKNADRAFQVQANQLRRQDALNRLAEEFVADHDERQFTERRKDVERQNELNEMEISQTIREEQLRQQADLDAQARLDKANMERMLNEAENKRILNDILHKIDESTLDWRQKLDEYTRLQRKINAEDQNEQLLNDAKVKQQVIREENETHLLVSGAKLQLDEAQAELMEKISRYAEDRQKRTQDHAADRAERKDTLAFEQRMRDRQEQVAQDMEKLAQQYEHELALRDRDDKLAEMQYENQKLEFILQRITNELNARVSVQTAQIIAEAEIQKAETQYMAQHEKEQQEAEEARMKERLKRDEEMARRAEEYQKMMINFQLDLEKLRHETERNKDNNQAQVGIEQAKSVGTHAVNDLQKAMDARYRNLQSAMDKITNAHKDLKAAVSKLTTQQPAGTNGNSGRNQGSGDIAVTGGLMPTNGKVSGGQPGIGTKTCPSCGRHCSILAAFCEYCGHSL